MTLFNFPGSFDHVVNCDSVGSVDRVVNFNRVYQDATCMHVKNTLYFKICDTIFIPEYGLMEEN